MYTLNIRVYHLILINGNRGIKYLDLRLFCLVILKLNECIILNNVLLCQ